MAGLTPLWLGSLDRHPTDLARGRRHSTANDEAPPFQVIREASENMRRIGNGPSSSVLCSDAHIRTLL